MNKIGRNEPCPCGSGKKYKKCCIDLAQELLPKQDFSKGTATDYTELTRKYDTLEFFKILSLLQLQPENHGKNVRIDELVVSAINTFNSTKGALDLVGLQRDLNKYCPYHPHEDPVEDFFTENIIFYNGNNTVYPGTFVEGKEIVQLQLETLRSFRKFPQLARKEITDGILFLLHIHHHTAQAFGHPYRMEGQRYADELFIPRGEELARQLGIIEFSPAQIKEICEKISVPENVIDQFVFTIPKAKIKLGHPDENPMFRQPFVFMDGKYLLVMPSGQLSCINDFILSKLKAYHLLNEFRELHADLVMDKVNVRCRSMRWKPLNYPFAEGKDQQTAIYREMLYHFDTDKLGYVMLLSPPSFAMGPGIQEALKNMQREAKTRITSVVAELRKQLPGRKIFFVLVTAKHEIFQGFSYDLSSFETADRNLALSFKELNVLLNNWDLNHLSLWKYAGHQAQTRKEILFMPVNTHLSIYKWYKDHHEWFFHSDNEPSNMMFFEFDIEGGVNRSAKQKEDLLGIPFPIPGGLMGYVPCHKSEEHLPVYLDDQFAHGRFRHSLMSYSCPIWVQSDQMMDFSASVYTNAVLYWLNFSTPWLQEWMRGFGIMPIVITLMMDQGMFVHENWDIDTKDKPFQFKRKVLVEVRAVELSIQPELITHLINSGNGGEKFLMKEVIGLLGELLEQLGLGSRLNSEELDGILDQAMPLGNQKMILITDASPNPRLADIDIDQPRYIPDADISYILHHQVSWLKREHPIPKKITKATDKVKLFNDLVGIHFNKIIASIHRFATTDLLVHLMERHESIMQIREKSRMAFPTLEACYGGYYDVFKEYSEREANVVSTSLALRSLIEFVACEKSSGIERPNDDDTDLMLALMSELINYGSMSDMVHHGISDPEMGILPSGRIGIDQTFSDTALAAFRNEIHLEEVEGHRSSFDRYFTQRTKKEKAQPGDDPYYDRVDEVFIQEWGVTIWDLQGASEFLCLEMFHKLNSSVAVISEADLLKIFCGDAPGGEQQARSIINLLTFRERNGVMGFPPKEKHEAFPWRYNRRESYMLRPLIKTVKDELVSYIVSGRHVVTAAENILSRFLDGTLKVGKDQFKLINLLAERNHIKGKNFRDMVTRWLSEHTELQVYDFEVKIKPNGFFKAADDKGDVDILCVDHSARKIISIECKNTSQAKIAYDMHTEITSYIGTDDKPGMIQKHVQRDKWLKENLNQVQEKLDLKEPYQVSSIVLTKHVLPTKFLRGTDIPVRSYSEIRRGDVFALKSQQDIAVEE